MKITAQDLLRFGVVDTIVPEPTGGAHRDPAAAITATAEAIAAALADLQGLDRATIVGSGGRSSWRSGEPSADLQAGAPSRALGPLGFSGGPCRGARALSISRSRSISHCLCPSNSRKI